MSEAIETRSVFISGGLSPLSRGLAAALTAAGHSVALWVASSADADAAREFGALPVYGDPTDVALVSGNLKLTESDVVVHLAPMAYNTPPFVRRDWSAAADALKAQTAALVAGVQANDGVKQFITTSYTFLYADAEDPVNEDAPLREKSVSGFIAAALDAEHAAAEVNATVLRIGYLFSDAADDPTHKLEAMLKRGFTPGYFGAADSLASWARTEDVLSAVVGAITNEATGVYNIAADNALSPYNFLSALGSKIGLSVPANVPAFMASGMFGKDYAALLGTSVAVDNAKARESLGWTPKFATVEAGLDDMLLAWRATA
jgi:nucleoside-diphosphate-sugar epimerase